MAKCVYRCKFQASETMYSYIGEDGITITDTLYAIVPNDAQFAKANTYNMAIVKVESVLDEVKDSWEGEYKEIISFFDIKDYRNRLDKQKELRKLLAKAEQRAEEMNKIKKLETAIGEDEEGKKLLERINQLRAS